MSRPRRRLISAVVATIAIVPAVTAMVAIPATAAVPGPPTSVIARAGDQLAEVTWNAPTPDDPTITGYEVTASPADTPAVTVDPTARTATVTGLTNRTAYSFTVAATNLDGPSPPSEPSAPVTPGPPAATTLTLAASPTSVLYGGTVQFSGRLQQSYRRRLAATPARGFIAKSQLSGSALSALVPGCRPATPDIGGDLVANGRAAGSACAAPTNCGAAAPCLPVIAQTTGRAFHVLDLDIVVEHHSEPAHHREAAQARRSVMQMTRGRLSVPNAWSSQPVAASVA